MDDPFGEFQQVSETQVDARDTPQEIRDEHAPITISVTAVDSVPEDPIRRETYQRHRNKRRAFYDKEQAKLSEIHAIMDRLYSIRYDTTRNKQDVIVDVKNLLAELNRLNEELSMLREKGMLQYAESLELDELGIARRIRTRSFRKPSTVDFESDDKNVGLMRTKSTNTLQGKPAEEKWQGLFRMFKEWKFQTSVAEAQHMLQQSEVKGDSSAYQAQLLEEEKNKIRAAIFQLKQRKNLNEADKNLLVILQTKLRALSQI